MAVAAFCFHAELNDFLAPAYREQRFLQSCASQASVKHMIEALGVPHTEVGLILVDGAAVSFSYRLQDGDKVDVHPFSVSLELHAHSIADSCLRPVRPAVWSFIADAHLGLLARQLRMLGFDTLYRNDYDDAEVAAISRDEGRVVLTRDRDLLIRKDIVYGCYLHARRGTAQLAEVVRRYRLAQQIRMFSRCMNCNGRLLAVPKAQVADRVPPRSREANECFHLCEGCGKVYWEGSHVQRMRMQVRDLLHADPNAGTT